MIASLMSVLAAMLYVTTLEIAPKAASDSSDVDETDPNVPHVPGATQTNPSPILNQNEVVADPKPSAACVGDDDALTLVEASRTFHEIANMIDFALLNPDRTQVPLAYRDEISQTDWDSMSQEERDTLQARIE